MKKLISAALILVLCFALSVNVFAGTTSIMKGRTRDITSDTSLDVLNVHDGVLNVKSGATLTVTTLNNTTNGRTVIQNGGTLIVDTLYCIGKFTVESGGTVIVNSDLTNIKTSVFTLNGTLRSGEYCKITGDCTVGITMSDDAVFDVLFDNSSAADKFASHLPEKMLQRTDNRVTAHFHRFENSVCTVCGARESSSAASVLSGGSLWIILPVAALAVGGVAALVIVKKKRSL